MEVAFGATWPVGGCGEGVVEGAGEGADEGMGLVTRSGMEAGLGTGGGTSNPWGGDASPADPVAAPPDPCAPSPHTHARVDTRAFGCEPLSSERSRHSCSIRGHAGDQVAGPSQDSEAYQ